MNEQTQITEEDKAEVQAQTNENWLDEELSQFSSHPEFEELPSLKLEENKVVTVEINFSTKFEKWSGETNGKPVTKAIIPVMVKGVKHNWWLNVRNPVYGQLCEKGKAGETKFKIMQTGKQASTKYVIVED